jgi:hypothetical protein
MVRRDQQSCPSLRSGPQPPSGLHEAFPAQFSHVARFAAHHRQGVKFMQTQATHAEPTTMFNEIFSPVIASEAKQQRQENTLAVQPRSRSAGPTVNQQAQPLVQSRLPAQQAVGQRVFGHRSGITRAKVDRVRCNLAAHSLEFGHRARHVPG